MTRKLPTIVVNDAAEPIWRGFRPWTEERIELLTVSWDIYCADLTEVMQMLTSAWWDAEKKLWYLPARDARYLRDGINALDLGWRVVWMSRVKP